MKKLLFAVLIMFLMGISYGQGVKKGNLIGTHVATVTLQPGVTMEQYADFCTKTYIPEYEKLAPGVKLFLLKGIRGDNKNDFGLLFIFESELARNKFFKDDGSQSELGKSVQDKMKPFIDKLDKLGTMSTKYTDWIVQ